MFHHIVEYILEGYLTHFSSHWPDLNTYSNMDLKVIGKCFFKEGSGMVIDEACNKLPAVYLILQNDSLRYHRQWWHRQVWWWEMDAIYQADDRYFDFFEEKVRKLQVKKSQGIITSVFQALTGSRCKTRRKQVTIPPTPLIMGIATPVTAIDAQATPTLPYQNWQCQCQ